MDAIIQQLMDAAKAAGGNQTGQLTIKTFPAYSDTAWGTLASVEIILFGPQGNEIRGHGQTIDEAFANLSVDA